MPKKREETPIEQNIRLGIRRKMLENSSEPKPDSFRVSELVYCKRKPYLHRKLDAEPVLVGRMLNGTLFHDIMPDVTKEITEFNDVVFEKDMSMGVFTPNGDYTVTGHCDGVNNDTIYEFKYTKRTNYTENSMPLQYILQVNLYMKILNKKHAKIVLIDSETLDVRVYDYDFDEKLAGESLKDINEIYNCIKNDTIPEGPRYDWECSFCDVAEECFKERGLEDEYKEVVKIKNAIKWKGIHSRKKKRVILDERNERLVKLTKQD